MALGQGYTKTRPLWFLPLCNGVTKTRVIFLSSSLFVTGLMFAASFRDGSRSKRSLYPGELQLGHPQQMQALRSIQQTWAGPSVDEGLALPSRIISQSVNYSSSHQTDQKGITTEPRKTTSNPPKPGRDEDTNPHRKPELQATETRTTKKPTQIPALSREAAGRDRSATRPINVRATTIGPSGTQLKKESKPKNPVVTDGEKNSSGAQVRSQVGQLGSPHISQLQPSAPLVRCRRDGVIRLTKPRTTDFGLNLPRVYDFLYGWRSDTHQSADSQDAARRRPCLPLPPNTVGAIRVFKRSFPIADLNRFNFHTQSGGSYSPSECVAEQSVAVIIPYRNRREHLATLLLNLHPFLQKQQTEYTIFVINQTEGSKFNRAMLLNVGAMEALKRRKYDCLIFHDVDLLPENDRNLYRCPNSSVRHMSVAIDKLQYRLPYPHILGGIVAIRWDLFVEVNGHSNQFFGWGGEDDDFSSRCREQGVNITRYSNSVARYQMIWHGHDKGNEKNPMRFTMLRTTTRRQNRDGLNSLTYKLDSISEEPLYTQTNVVINQRDVMNAKPKALPEFPFQLVNHLRH